ncbi:MAG: hypothetical protein ACE5H5_07715 [Nitrospinota bacterium]
MTDFPLPDLETLGRRAWEAFGFKAEVPDVKIAGTCRQCQR